MIFKRCIDYTSGGLRYNVGPGYIARLTRNGALLVNDFRGRSDTGSPGLINEVNGGLGTFGWHHARGAANGTPAGDDPTTPAVELGVGRNPKAIEGRMCAGTNGANGAYARSWSGPTRISNTRVDYTIDVWLRDSYGATGRGPGNSAIARIRYRYSFYRSSVRTWIAVTTYATVNSAGTPFVKEPKLTAIARGGGFTRISVLRGSDGNGFLLGMMAGQPEGTQDLGTSHSDADTRKRTRWDYAPNTSGSAAPGCSTAQPCLNTVMRAYPSSGESVLRGGPAADWEGSGTGLDQWAVLSGARAKAYPRDTRGDLQVTSCGVALSGADCEPLQRSFGPQGETWASFGSYSLNDGWTLG